MKTLSRLFEIDGEAMDGGKISLLCDDCQKEGNNDHWVHSLLGRGLSMPR